MLCNAFLLTLLAVGIAAGQNAGECATRELTDTYITVPAKTSGWSVATSLDMYHYNGFECHVTHMFMDVYLQINLTNEQSYQLYQGENCSEMLQHYRTDQHLWGLVQRVKLLRSKQLSPFQKTIVGISTKRAYALRIRVWKINYMRLAVFVGGIVLFLMSHSLVRNAIFYYTSGCTIGLLASLLIVGFIIYRLTPKSWMGIPLVFGGWSVSLCIVYMIWKNFASLVLQYQKFVAAYFATVILISFAVCYRYGPPSDIRSHNLAQWALQLIALVLIYSSCQIPDVSIGFIALLLLWSISKKWMTAVASKFVSILGSVWSFLFPQCQRLLTMEEYQRQGEEETRKALEQLRQYCRSPEANVWKITSSVSDPKRLASFVDGTSDHVSEEESYLYDIESANLEDLSDDSGEDEYVVAQHSRLNNSHEPPRRKYEGRESIPAYHSRSADRIMNHKHLRQTLNEHEIVDSDEDDDNNEFSYDWQSHSLPLKNAHRTGHRNRDLYESGPVTSNNSFHCFRCRGKASSSNRSYPTANLGSDSQVELNLQQRYQSAS